jgi:hypothetical protein
MRRGRGNQPNRASHKTLKWDRLRQRYEKEDARRDTPISREKLIADQARLEAQLSDAEPGPYRDKLERKLGQIRVALNLSSWAYSPDYEHGRLSWRSLSSDPASGRIF